MGISSALFYSTADTEKENTLHYRIRPSDEQYNSQQERWSDLRDFLIKDLSEKTGCSMQSWLQGSYKFGTQIRPSSMGEEFDIDLGVYFKWDGDPDDGDYSPKELKDYVHDSLQAYSKEEENDAEEGIKTKDRCERIHFLDDFHIDVPVYHLNSAADERALATEDDEWEESDPKEIYLWWKETFDETNRPLARRMVRYFKMWAALNIDADSRPSSILLTVLVGEALEGLAADEYQGDDECFHLLADIILKRLNNDTEVLNPVNDDENLNRLSYFENVDFTNKLESLTEVAERALGASSAVLSAETWSEVFSHFFPIPEEEQVNEAVSSNALCRFMFDPQVKVMASVGNDNVEGINQIGPIPRGCDLEFELINDGDLPFGATVHWMVRNSGEEAELYNDLGHSRGEGYSCHESTAYKGLHYMDITVRLDRQIIGRRRVPVSISASGFPKRNPSSRPAWNKFRKARR